MFCHTVFNRPVVLQLLEIRSANKSKLLSSVLAEWQNFNELVAFLITQVNSVKERRICKDD